MPAYRKQPTMRQSGRHVRHSVDIYDEQGRRTQPNSNQADHNAIRTTQSHGSNVHASSFHKITDLCLPDFAGQGLPPTNYVRVSDFITPSQAQRDRTRVTNHGPYTTSSFIVPSDARFCDRPFGTYLPPTPTPSPTDSTSPYELFSSSSSEVETGADSRKKHTRRKEAGHVPRPRNAFIIFRSDFIQKLKEEAEAKAAAAAIAAASSTAAAILANPPGTAPSAMVGAMDEALDIMAQKGEIAHQSQQHELSKLAGKKWLTMSPEEKMPFEEQARKEKDWHRKTYPDYRYSPGNVGLGGKKARGARKGKGKGKGKQATKVSAKVMGMGQPQGELEDATSPETISDMTSNEETDVDVEVEIIESPVPRSSRVRRAAAIRAAERFAFERSLSPSPEPVEQVLSSTEHSATERQMNNESQTQPCFVPTEGIPVLDLGPSVSDLSYNFRAQMEKFQSGYDVDLTPRSMAYDNAKKATGIRELSVPHVSGVYFTSGTFTDEIAAQAEEDQEVATQASDFHYPAELVATPTPALDPSFAYPDSSYASSSTYFDFTLLDPNAYMTTFSTQDHAYAEQTLGYDFSATYAEPVAMSYEPHLEELEMGLSLGYECQLEVPDLGLGLGDAGMVMNSSFEWQGYGYA